MGSGMSIRRAGRAILGSLVAAVVLAGAASPALAAKPSGHGGGGGGGGHGSVLTGNDVSYPQCGGSLPASAAFGVVGLNGGLANTLNPCFGTSTSYPAPSQSQLYWALASTTGGTSQPKASIYVNTGDPGNVYNGTAIADWPTSGSTPYGDCLTTAVALPSGTYTLGENSAACAWQYGHDRASQDVAWLADAAAALNTQQTTLVVPGAASAYPWWLDVETGNSWQSDTTMNVADLQGMVAALQAAGAGVVGIYSTSSQWGTITGGSSAGSLAGLPNWIPGARTLSGARSNCSATSFTGGRVALTQWFANPDGDYSC